MKFKLATYGTLRSGEPRFYLIQEYSPINSTVKKINGFKMFDLGEFPGAIKTNAPKDEIVIEIFEFDMHENKVKELIKTLDIIEGVSYNYYKKELINVDGDDALIYLLTDDLYSRIKSYDVITDWCSRR